MVNKDRTLQSCTSERTWERRGEHLGCALEVHPSVLLLAREHALHRLRAARSRSRGFVHPVDVSVDSIGIQLHFEPGALDRESSPDLYQPGWVHGVLVPLLEAVVLCHDNHVSGFRQTDIVAGQCVPPVDWFLPRPDASLDGGVQNDDCRVVGSWLEAELRRVELQEPERRDAEEAKRALIHRGAEGLRTWLAEWNVEERLGGHGVPAAGLARCLTEFELFARMGEVLRFRVLDDAVSRQFGISPSDGLVLRVDKNWLDPHFGRLERPSPQELWDQLTEDSRTTPWLAVSSQPPNALERSSPEAAVIRWVGVHPDQPLIYVEANPRDVDKEGYIRTLSAGDDTLMERKRRFAGFADRHGTIRPLLAIPPAPNAFVSNSLPRQRLEEAVLETRGVFAVQGPPGTGKTHLASQVVRHFLEQTPGGRVLVCSKEHFALDHIVKKITETLGAAGITFRAWRSVPLGKRGAEIAVNPWSAPSVSRDLASRAWSADAIEWAGWQAATIALHDQRLYTLGRESANVVFTTTCDMTMCEFLDKDSFDLVIVEEAGKCYPSELLHALCLGRTALMIGDQFQLPPYQEDRTREGAKAWREAIRVAGSDDGRRAELKGRFGDLVRALGPSLAAGNVIGDDSLLWLRPFEFLFDRLQRRYRLDEQFRLEAPLSRVVGSVFYQAPFNHRKYDLPAAVRPNPRPLGNSVPSRFDVPLLWLNTSHMAEEPEATEDRAKRGVRDNHYERDVVHAYLKSLRPLQPLDLVILTPYRAQKQLLLRSEELRAVCAGLSDKPFESLVRTTDEYQGREAELTVLSLVRNNSLGARAWGFMTSPERLNVMFSRARFRQVVVGCSSHVERHASECPHLHAVWQAYQAEAANPRNARILAAHEVLHG
jgi:hypothetical protein